MLHNNTINNNSETYQIRSVSKFNNLFDIKKYKKLEIYLSYLLFSSFTRENFLFNYNIKFKLKE